MKMVDRFYLCAQGLMIPVRTDTGMAILPMLSTIETAVATLRHRRLVRELFSPSVWKKLQIP